MTRNHTPITVTDPAEPPLLFSGEPDWGSMEGKTKGNPPTKAEVLFEAICLQRQSEEVAIRG